MALSSTKSIIIVGGGIVGLTCAAALLANDYAVRLIRDAGGPQTASDVAAGMIAPALEAISDPDPVDAFRRLKNAQAMWLDLADLWPQELTAALDAARLQVTDYLATPEGLARLSAMGADFELASDQHVRLRGDWLLDSRASLQSLERHILALGGQMLSGQAIGVARRAVSLADGGEAQADEVIVAAGIGARALAEDAPSLACLTPIKGQLLDLPWTGRRGVLRGAGGYLAGYDGHAKFGATMEAGRDDVEIDPDRIADLKARAAALLSPDLLSDIDLSRAAPRAGVRAATPDGWPLIGRDPASGALVATGMRRNGYVFAPLAARLMLDLIEGRPADPAYAPDRFLSGR